LKDKKDVSLELLGFDREGKQVFVDNSLRQVERWPLIVQNSVRMIEIYDPKYLYEKKMDLKRGEEKEIINL
jgi:hypothetical protein